MRFRLVLSCVNVCAALVQNSVVYVFDLSAVDLETEDVVFSEVHLYKRRRWSRLSNRSPRWSDRGVAVGVYELTPSSIVQRTRRTVTGWSAGWQTLDVTDIVTAGVDSLGDRTTPPVMIAVSFADLV